MRRPSDLTLPFLIVLGGCGFVPGGGGDGDTFRDLAMPTAMDGGADSGGGAVEPKLSSLYTNYLGRCANCHAPNAPGRTSDTEMTLDFSTPARAFATLTSGTAMGLKGNHAGCNGAPFVQPMAGRSLLVAVVDQPTRKAFDLPMFPDCDETAISDETVKVGAAPSAAFIASLKQWVNSGAPNN